MLAGSSGCGKSIILKHFLQEIVTSNLNIVEQSIDVNYFTESIDLQRGLDQNLEKRSGRTFGPQINKSLVICLDDLNLPKREEYGTQTALALLTQLLDHHFLYDRDDLSLKKSIVDTKIITGLNPAQGCFEVSARAQRHFSTITCMTPLQEDLLKNFSNLFSGSSVLSSEFQVISAKVLSATIGVLTEVEEKLLRSVTKFTYIWSLREIKDVLQGLILFS
ncbi:MAG: hypothetical protein AAGM67_19900, partial [Bacteroidota bacterium]